MKTPIIVTLVALVALVALGSFTPVASAGGPECLQVYPWSELCQGDVGGFLEGMGITPAIRPLPEPNLPHVDCVQVYPWSELCEGDVGAFVAYYVGQFAPILP